MHDGYQLFSLLVIYYEVSKEHKGKCHLVN